MRMYIYATQRSDAVHEKLWKLKASLMNSLISVVSTFWTLDIRLCMNALKFLYSMYNNGYISSFVEANKPPNKAFRTVIVWFFFSVCGYACMPLNHPHYPDPHNIHKTMTFVKCFSA